MTIRETIARIVRQHRLLRAQQQISRAAERLHAAGQHDLAIAAYTLAVKIGGTP